MPTLLRSVLAYLPWAGYILMAGFLIQDAFRTQAFGNAGVVLLLGALSLWCLLHFAEAIEREGSLQVESHWGGLGGGVGGFRISRSMLYLAGALFFGGFSVLAYYPRLIEVATQSTAQTKPPEAKSSETKSTAAAPAATGPAETKPANPGR